ncbi:MAG: response regulator [Nitrospirae bacterium]|nr:response regulator [Nitrospirota bacterium]
MPFNGLKAVVVDDSELSLAIIEDMARNVGLDTSLFLDPLEALEHIKNNPVDMVFVDYVMPGMNGVELIREIRAVHSDIPIIMITVISDDPALRIEALESGATDFLTKPFDIPEFRARTVNLATLRHFQMQEKERGDDLENEVRKATGEIVQREHETLDVLSKAAQFRDYDIGNHAMRLSCYSHILSQGMGLDQKTQDLVLHAAPLNDIGKIGISDSILLKPGKLTSVEFEMVKHHTTMGYEILKDRSSHYLEAASIIAVSHHEKYDGTGYPFGLAGEDIPVFGRIVAVADVFEVLTSRRPYKEAFPFDDAVRILEEGSGNHFDPKVISVFMRNIGKIREAYIRFTDAAL